MTALSTPPLHPLKHTRARAHTPRRPQYDRVGMINSGPVGRWIDPPSSSLTLSLSLPSTNTKLYTAINSCLSLHPSSALPARIDSDYC